jgi:ATP-dependent DNA helicase RecG
MNPIRIFISSVQKEFSRERIALREYLRGDALMRRFFEVFLFEEIPAKDQAPDKVYLREVEQCDVYVGLLGDKYGFEDDEGISPTEREFDLATELNKDRLIFIKGGDDSSRHPKMRALIGKAQAGLIRRRFNSPAELVADLYSALVEYLADRKLIRSEPFDAAPCLKAKLDDLNSKRMAWFVRTARKARRFPLAEDASPRELLEHLNLMDEDRLTNAAILLFGTQPQRYLLSSEIKCAHFHGTDVAKPIPSYQVYKGTAFDLVDQAVDFVLSKISFSVGTREVGVRVPVSYEIPKEVIGEAIVNAVAHRDYTSNGSVQVMLFKDRLEIWNPGQLPPSLTLKKLREVHGSVPKNPLLAESMYLARYIERMGTGTRDMIRRCVEAGLPEPEFMISDGFLVSIGRNPAKIIHFPGPYPESVGLTGEVTGEVAGEVAGEVTGEVVKLLMVCEGEMSRRALQNRLELKGEDNFRNLYLMPALAAGLIEMTRPDKPRSRLQKYRLTGKGKSVLSKGR